MRLRSAAALLLVLAAACAPPVPEGKPPGTRSAEPSVRAATTPAGALLATGLVSASPAATCVPSPTPNDPEPSHAPINGQPSLAGPVRTGVVLIQIAQCREISELLRKYGIVGPAARYIEGDPDRAHGAERWFVVNVPAGTESATVLQLFAHPEDFDYVQLVPAAVPGLNIPVDPSPSSPPLPALPPQPPLPPGATTTSSGTIAFSIPAGAFADIEAQRLIPTAPPSAALVWTISWGATDALNASWYRQIARVELGRGKFGSVQLGGAGFRLTNDTAGPVSVELRYVIGSR